MRLLAIGVLFLVAATAMLVFTSSTLASVGAVLAISAGAASIVTGALSLRRRTEIDTLLTEG